MMPPIAVLAGGLATRLRPLTATIPKALVDVAGQPFIARQLRLLRDCGLTEVVICAGYLGEQIEAQIGQGADFGVRVRYSFDGDALLGTGGALRKALPLLGDEFLAVYGDSYLEVDYERIYAQFRDDRRLGLMTVYENAGRWDASNVLFRNGTIHAYDKTGETPGMAHIDYGLSALRAAAFREFPEGEAFDLVALFQRLIADKQLMGVEVHQRFYEVGSREGIADLCAHLADRSKA